MTRKEIETRAFQKYDPKTPFNILDAFIEGVEEGLSEKEGYAEGKVEEYKRELFADFKRRNLYNPTLSFLEMAINSVNIFTPKEDK